MPKKPTKAEQDEIDRINNPAATAAANADAKRMADSTRKTEQAKKNERNIGDAEAKRQSKNR